MTGPKRNHLEDSKIEIDILRSEQRVARVRLWAGGKGVNVLSIAVEPDDWIRPESACDVEDGRELESGEETHDGAGVGVCRGVLRVIQIRADQPETAQRNAVPLILKRECPLRVKSVGN